MQVLNENEIQLVSGGDDTTDGITEIGVGSGMVLGAVAVTVAIVSTPVVVGGALVAGALLGFSAAGGYIMGHGIMKTNAMNLLQ